MRHLRNILLIGLLACCGAGCDSFGDNNLGETIETRLFPVKIDGRWGYVDAQGRIALEPIFREAGPFIEGRALAKESSKRGFIDASGTFIREPNFESAYNFSDGVAGVRIEGQWGYIDRSGSFVIEPRYRKACPFSEGRAFVRTEDHDWVYVDLLGGVVRSENTPDLREIEESAFSDGLALVKNHEGIFGFIDRSGEPVIAPQFSAAKAFSDGYAAVKISDRWGFIDQSKAFVITPKFIEAGHFKEGLAPVRENTNTWGYVNHQGEMVITPAFEQARPFAEGRAAVMLNGRWGYIDLTGAWIREPEFAEAEAFHLGLGRVRLDVGEAQRYGYVDRDGSYVWFPSD